MMMTEEEIRTSFREARYPKRQLHILAELNLVSVEKIERIVGYSPKPRTRHYNTKWALRKEDEDAIVALWKEDATIAQIAARVGIPTHAVNYFKEKHRDLCPHRSHRLTEEQLDEIKHRHLAGQEAWKIAKAVGINVSTVYQNIKKIHGGNKK